MSTKSDLAIDLPETERKAFMVLETSEQRQSLYDPVRREILRTLDGGIEDFESEVKRTERVLKDGTRVVEELTVKKPTRRYWMTAQEIVDLINAKDETLGVTNYNCYYHLHKLSGQGLVEQYPPRDASDSKGRRVRGMYFRTAARFFVPTAFEISPGLKEADVLPPEVNKRAVELAQKVKASGVADAFEYSTEIGGTTYWFSMTMSLHDDGESIVSVVRDISETRRAEEALRRSREQLDLALKGADLAPWDWYEKKKEMIFSKRFADFLGFSVKNLSKYGRDRFKLVHFEDVELVKQKWTEHFSGQTPFYSAEYRILTHDGTYKWVMDRGSIVERDNEGNPVRAAGTIRDVTWEKLTLEALGQSEEKYLRLVNDSIQGIAIIQKGRIVFANPAFAKIVGRAVGELLSMGEQDVWSLVEPKDRPMLEKRNEDSTEGLELPRHRFRYVRPNGEIRWVESYAKVIDYEGETALQAVEVDITDQYIAEQKLRQSEERYRELYENLSDGVITTDPEGIVTFCSPIAAEMFGYVPDDIITNSVEVLIHPEDRAWVISTFEANTLNLNERYEGLEARGLRKDGSIFYFHATGTAIRRDGQHIGFQSLVRNITERVESEKALRAQRDLAEMYLKMAGNIFLVLDQDGNISLLNRAGRHVLGLADGEDIVGASWFDFIPPEERAEVRDQFDQLIHGKLTHIDYRERRVVTRNGEERLIAWRTNLLYGDKKEIIGLLSSGEDITERRRSERFLEESEAKYRMLVERSNIGIAVLQYPPLRVLFTNEATINTLGFSSDDFTSFSEVKLESLVYPEDLPRFLRNLEVIMSGEVGQYHPSYEYRVYNRDGGVVWIRDAPQKVIYQGEPAILTIGIIITGEKERMFALEQRTEAYTAALGSIDEGFAMIEENRIVEANGSFLDMLEFPLDDVKDKLVWSLSPRKQPGNVSSKSKMQDLIVHASSGKIQKAEWKFRTSSGQDILKQIELRQTRSGGSIVLVVKNTQE
jgi:PAS domain S-box-containing protein